MVLKEAELKRSSVLEGDACFVGQFRGKTLYESHNSSVFKWESIFRLVQYVCMYTNLMRVFSIIIELPL